MNLFSLFSWASNAIDGQVAAIVAWVTAGFGVLFGDISAVNSFAGGLGAAIGGALTTLWNWLTQLWQWLYTHLIQKLQDLINRIKDALTRIFGPLLCHLKQAIATYKALWNTYVKPIFDFLQRIRRVLALFRLLGFKWAQQLDAKIVALESAISNSFLGVLANLNRIADWLNYIIDPFGMIQPGVLLGSIGQAAGAIVGIIFGQMNTSPGGAPGWVWTAPDGYLTGSAANTREVQRLTIGALPEDASIMANLRSAATDAGYPLSAFGP